MKKHICPRCGSDNIDWIIPQVWSKWSCKDCDYTGPAIEGDEQLAKEIREDWEKNKDKYLQEENKKVKKIDNNENENEDLSDEEIDKKLEEDEDLSDEEIDKKLEELNI